MPSHTTSMEECIDAACGEILKSLEGGHDSRVMLIGEAGMGKTWIARKILERVRDRENGSCYMSLWLNLNKHFDEVSLYENIASQLSVFLDKEESEEDDSEDEEEDQKAQDLTRLKVKIREKLLKKKPKFDDTKYFLLVLDDVEIVTTEQRVMKQLKLESFLTPFRPLKILLTKRKGDVTDDSKSNEGTESTMEGSETESDEEIKSNTTEKLHTKSDDEIDSLTVSELEAESDEEIKSNTTEKLRSKSDGDMDSFAVKKLEAGTDKEINFHTIEASTLRGFFTDDYMVNLFSSLIKNELLEDWILYIVRRSMGLPAAVAVLAKSLNCITQEKLFKRGVFSLFSSDLDPYLESATPSSNPILGLAYELLRTDDTVSSSIVNCFWHSLSFFEDCGCVCYQELIAHWILEGYFDPVRSVTKAYMDGHKVLMELIERGMLKIHEDNVVMPEVAMKNLIDLRGPGLLGTSRISLAKVFGRDRKQGLGRINQLDDIIEAVQTTRKGDKTTTILISADRLRRQTPEKFFVKLKDLEVLGLFMPTVDHFVPFLSKLVKLRVLVIRDCDLLEDIEELKALRGLHVLEVSGASSLQQISDDFFKDLPHLQSLHLSQLQIKSSPSSISGLVKLHCLIIKDCPFLEDLPDIQGLEDLEVVDISGAHGLQTCFDNTKGDTKKDQTKNRNFYLLKKLQLLDFSGSQIERLPMFQDAVATTNLPSLTRLLLRNCSKLRRLPNLKPLSGLQILDLSGTVSLGKMLEVCFEDKKELRILNLSGTNLCELASTIEELSSLKELVIRDCINLDVIPNIQKLTNLEVIDVSGSTKLQEIGGSFEDMSYLREVNLFGTKVEAPELPKVTRIHCVKSIILADGRRFEGETWSQIKDIEHERFVLYDEISENESEEIREIQSSEPRTSYRTEVGDASKERLHKVPIEPLYKKILLFLSEGPMEVMEINETNKLNEDSLANAEFVSFVDCSSARLASIFKKTQSVKYCWIRMCTDIKDLFSDVSEEHLKSLETLSISHLPSLEIICKLENLKNLSLEYCPKIKTIFAEMPSSLETVRAKHCEKLENFVEGAEVSTHTNLNLKVENCRKFGTLSKNLEVQTHDPYISLGEDGTLNW